jgi:hypothetical protein
MWVYAIYIGFANVFQSHTHTHTHTHTHIYICKVNAQTYELSVNGITFCKDLSNFASQLTHTSIMNLLLLTWELG